MTWFTFLVLVFFFFTACKKEEVITLDPKPEKVVPDNPTDVKIAQILDNYQSKVIYRWDRRYTNSDAKVMPPKFELILPNIELIEMFWINPYEMQKPGFMLHHMPIEIVLVGSTIDYSNGDERGFNAAGEAQSMSRVLLAGINYYDLKDTFWLTEQIKTMHHEFSHIIEKKYNRPVGFDDVSRGKYAGTSSFTEFTLETARERGFWSNYGMSNESEDFATMVEALTSVPKDEFLAEIKDNELLKRKYNLVYHFYIDLGIDLHLIEKEVADKLKGIQQ